MSGRIMVAAGVILAAMLLLAYLGVGAERVG